MYITDKSVAWCKSPTTLSLCKVLNFSFLSVSSIVQSLMNPWKQKLLLTRTETKTFKEELVIWFPVGLKGVRICTTNKAKITEISCSIIKLILYYLKYHTDFSKWQLWNLCMYGRQMEMINCNISKGAFVVHQTSESWNEKCLCDRTQELHTRSKQTPSSEYSPA